MIKVLYTSFDSKLPLEYWEHYRALLPISLQKKTDSYLRWQDQHAQLFGKLLLLKGLQDFGYAPDCLEQLRTNYYGKPYIGPGVHFNISHSGRYVLCAFSLKYRLGIDVEQVTPVDFNHFKSVFSAGEWQNVRNAEDSIKKFFTYWTIKESIIKGEEMGLSIPLQEICVVSEDCITYKNTDWHIRPLPIDADYIAHIAVTPAPAWEEISLQYTNYYQ